MAVTIGTELVNNGNSGWTQADVMDALEKVFYEMGFNNDDPRTTTMYLSVVNRSSVTTAIDITLTALKIGE